MSSVGNIRVCHMMCDYCKCVRAVFDEMVTITEAFKQLDFGSILVMLDKTVSVSSRNWIEHCFKRAFSWKSTLARLAADNHYLHYCLFTAHSLPYWNRSSPLCCAEKWQIKVIMQSILKIKIIKMLDMCSFVHFCLRIYWLESYLTYLNGATVFIGKQPTPHNAGFNLQTLCKLTHQSINIFGLSVTGELYEVI